MDDVYISWMLEALREAEKTSIDVPVGCVIVDKRGRVVSRSANSREVDGSLLGHAESKAILAIWGSEAHNDLSGFTLISTLEPCVVCAGIIRETGISKVIFGASNIQRGAAGSLYDLLRDKRLGRPIEVIAGILGNQCQELIYRFFLRIRSIHR